MARQPAKRSDREVGHASASSVGPPPQRGGNRGWCSGIISPIQPSVSEFERVVERLQLKPPEYVGSYELREWVERNKDARFVPECLLKAWGLSLRGSIDDIG